MPVDPPPTRVDASSTGGGSVVQNTTAEGSSSANPGKYERFYTSVDRDELYTKDFPEEFLVELKAWIGSHGLADGEVLEVGSGRGHCQDCVRRYTGVDVAESLRPYYRDPSRYVVVRDGERFPFPDGRFDGAFTYAVFEHIPSLENAFRELWRVVKPGGTILFHAAWQVRPWAARGLSVRSYRDLSWRDRLEKLTVPVRNSVVWRSLFVFPRRLWRTFQFLTSGRRRPKDWRIDCRKLQPNYEHYWQADSDACNHIDIHAAILWFMARGAFVEEYPTVAKAIKAKTGSFTVRKPI